MTHTANEGAKAHRPLVVTGEAIARAIRDEFGEKGTDAAVILARMVIPEITREQVLGLIVGIATLEGDSAVGVHLAPVSGGAK